MRLRPPLTSNVGRMNRIVLACHGLPASAGAEAATDITSEFRLHRPWHKNVRCTWDGTHLILEAENDYDPEGLALMDEFSDCISAYVAEAFDGGISVESISRC